MNKEQTTDILADTISFAVERLMKEFKNSDDESEKKLYSVLQRSEKMWETIKIHWLEPYGLSYEQFCDECDKKKNIVFMSDEEIEEYNKAIKIMKVMKE